MVIGDTTGIVVSSVTYDHRDVNPGALHCCLPGDHVDGAVFASAARRAGAVAFVCERDLGDEAGGGVQLVVGKAGGRTAMALAACALWGDPASSLRTVGVTGTNGKTTTTFFLRSVFEEHGWPTTVIGTLGGPRTTPEAPDLQRALAGARDSLKAAVALEVTSHALAQHRVDGYQHDVAVFTNLSQDHLDYHGSMEDYFAVKAQLFTPEHSNRGVVNADDPFGSRLLESAEIPTRAFSLSDAEQLEVGLEESRFRLDGSPVRVRPGGEINVRNVLAAAAAARVLGVPGATIAAGLSVAEGPAGRLEVLPNHLGVTIAVDYAHTPDALAEILRAARAGAEPEGGKVIVVFGCGGDRDPREAPFDGVDCNSACRRRGAHLRQPAQRGPTRDHRRGKGGVRRFRPARDRSGPAGRDRDRTRDGLSGRRRNRRGQGARVDSADR